MGSAVSASDQLPAPREGALVAHEILVRFGGLVALGGVTLELSRPRIVGLIGPNGAGKTTFINVASGYQEASAGSVFLNEADVTKWSVARRAHHGLSRTFQGIRLFGDLTVAENIEVGALGVGLGRKVARAQARELLGLVGLTADASRPAHSLPHGRRRLAGLARALATRPRFVLLDEPAAGLGEEEVDQLLVALVGIRDQFDIGMLVVEHDMRLVMNVCESIYVLDHGRVIAEGIPTDLRKNPEVLRAYLGSHAEDVSV
jgi:branched-chain amino acid transport system ATP-binding protein